MSREFYYPYNGGSELQVHEMTEWEKLHNSCVVVSCASGAYVNEAKEVAIKEIIEKRFMTREDAMAILRGETHSDESGDDFSCSDDEDEFVCREIVLPDVQVTLPALPIVEVCLEEECHFSELMTVEECAEMDLFGDACGPMPGRGRGRGKMRRGAGFRRGGGLSMVPRNMTVPARETVKLRTVFNDVINNATLAIPYGYAYVNLTNPLKSNGGAATIVPFWTEQQGRQRKYRVFKTRVSVSAVNQEAFGVDFGIVAMNSLLVQTVANCKSSLSNIRCRKKLVSGVGSPNRCDLRSQQSITDFAGFYTRGAEDNYVGLTDGSADPTDNIYLMIIADTNGAASVSGILVSVTVEFVVDFMEPQNAVN